MKIVRFVKDFFQFTAFSFKLLYKFVHLILMITGVISFVKCSSGFTKKGDKVYYNGEEIGKDFVILNDQFAKNDSSAYYKMKSISEADVPSFEALNENYAKDKTNVFYCDEEREVKNFFMTKRQGVYILEGADAPTFKMIASQSFGYAKDKKRGYINGRAFDVKDVASLELIDNIFLKDKYQVYCYRVPVQGSDPASFQNIGEYYYKDKNRIYTFKNGNEMVIVPCSPVSFAIIEYPYSKDATNVFHVEHKISGADVATFKKLENEYSKDNFSAYFEDKKIDGADAATFEVDKGYENTTDESYFAKDKNHVYQKNKIFPDVDLKTFQALEQGYTKDSKHVYFDRKIVKGADPVTFECFGLQVGAADSKDSRNKYLKGKPAED